MTYLKQVDGEGKLEIENVEGAIILRYWPADNGDPVEFKAESQMDLNLLQVSIDLSPYERPGRKAKKK